MEKIKKGYNAKVVALTIGMLFLFINIAYSLDISCLRVPLKFGSLGAEQQLRNLTGDPKNFDTFKVILDSVGAFDNGTNFLQRYRDDMDLSRRSELTEFNKTWHIPFMLNENGIGFFKELFDIESVDKEAYLLLYNNKEKTGFENLPFGLLLKDSKSKRTFFFNLTGLFLLKPGPSTSLALDTAYISYKPEHYGVFKLIENWLPGYDKWPNERKLERRRAFLYYYKDGRNLGFEMLIIDREDIFGFWDAYSEDFQRAVYENADLIKDRNVVEVGVGTGVNILHALRFGARSVIGTDISCLYVLLSRWQVQFAQDTGQVPILPEGSVQILHQSGFPKGISGDFYVINMPCIISSSRKAEQDKMLGKLRGNSLFISEEDFVVLFEELKQRLSSPNVLALCRILAGFPDRSEFFPEPRQETINRLGGFFDREYGLAIARATEFLEKRTDGIIITPNDDCRNIFLLRSPVISTPKTVGKCL